MLPLVPAPALLFDLYGTLVTPSTSWRIVRNRLQGSTKAERDALRIQLLTTSSGILPSLDADDETLREELEADLRGIQLYPEVLEVLATLRERRIPMAVVSNLSSRYCDPFHSLGLNRFFDVVTFSCEVGFAKPNRKIFEHACNKLGVHLKQATMIGDSLAQDVQGAEAAGLQAILVDRTDRYRTAHGIRSRCSDLRGALRLLDAA